ncbi:hypothetical protein ACFZCF_02750 [Streptomyces sp. NPDC007945]|uniref:hypothetical protein n=1 Tax=Streptomyces sp. NPDC007945 TaxID=3364797 RepID=UPI0036E7246F
MSAAERELGTLQRVVLGAAFVPMLVTGGAGGYGTYTNIKAAYGSGTAVGAVAAGEGATAVLAIVLLGLTLLGQSSPRVIRAGLWALPAAAAAMSATAATTLGEMVIYALTPMGMTASAEGAAFLARRIVVYRDGRDAEAEAHAADLVQAIAYQRAMSERHPDPKVRKKAELAYWKLGKKVGAGDIALGTRLVDVQRDRVTAGADAALADMFTVTRAVTPPVTAEPIEAPKRPVLEAPAPARDGEDTQVTAEETTSGTAGVTPVTPSPVTPVTAPVAGPAEEPTAELVEPPVTLAEVAVVTGVTVPEPSVPLTDEQLIVVLRYLRYSVDPPLSYRQAAAAFREQGFVGAESRIRTAWGALMSQEETTG